MSCVGVSASSVPRVTSARESLLREGAIATSARHRHRRLFVAETLLENGHDCPSTARLRAVLCHCHS